MLRHVHRKWILFDRRLGIFGNSRKMFGNVRLAFGTILENLRKSSESGRKSSENHQKRRHQYAYIIKRTLHVSSKQEKITLVQLTYPKGWTGSFPLCPLIFSCSKI